MQVLRRRSEAGSALILTVVIMLIIVGIAGAYLALTAASSQLSERDAIELHALYCAESAAALVVSHLNAGTLNANTDNGPISGNNAGGIGQRVLSVADDTDLSDQLSGTYGNGRYEVTVALWGYDGLDNNNDGTVDEDEERAYLTVTSRGQAGDRTRQIEYIVGRPSGGVFWNAIYQGGSGAMWGGGDPATDPSYAVTFKGTGRDADYIKGSVYINGQINVQGQASMAEDSGPPDNIPYAATSSGDLTNNGTGTGWGDWSRGTQPLFDINARDYPNNNNYNVLNALKTKPNRTYGPGRPPAGNPVGGNAWQLPATEPEHVFRLNPSDRRAVYPQYDSVVALEDPWERLQNDANWNGTDATKISFTDQSAAYGKTYFIGPTTPGEKVAMIIDNTSTYSYKFLTPGTPQGQQIVIAVQGDIVIGDNIFYNNQNSDAVVFIALKNPDGTGGNIYYGDPRYGTVENFNAYMFAENNFISTNVSDSRTQILVNGNMAAGNQILMNLDSGRGTHHKWQVIFDDRLRRTMENDPNLPQVKRLDGVASEIPPNPQNVAGLYAILSSRQISASAEPMTTGYVFP